MKAQKLPITWEKVIASGNFVGGVWVRHFPSEELGGRGRYIVGPVSAISRIFGHDGRPNGAEIRLAWSALGYPVSEDSRRLKWESVEPVPHGVVSGGAWETSMWYSLDDGTVALGDGTFLHPQTSDYLARIPENARGYPTHFLQLLEECERLGWDREVIEKAIRSTLELEVKRGDLRISGATSVLSFARSFGEWNHAEPLVETYLALMRQLGMEADAPPARTIRLRSPYVPPYGRVVDARQGSDDLSWGQIAQMAGSGGLFFERHGENGAFFAGPVLNITPQDEPASAEVTLAWYVVGRKVNSSPVKWLYSHPLPLTFVVTKVIQGCLGGHYNISPEMTIHLPDSHDKPHIPSEMHGYPVHAQELLLACRKFRWREGIARTAVSRWARLHMTQLHSRIQSTPTLLEFVGHFPDWRNAIPYIEMYVTLMREKEETSVAT